MVNKIFATGIASADAAAMIDMRQDCRITGMLISWSATGQADGSRFDAEVSFGSTSGFLSNDTTSSLATIRSSFELATQGASQVGGNVYIPMDEAVGAGERLYVHTFVATATYFLTVTIYNTAKGDRPSVRRR